MALGAACSDHQETSPVPTSRVTGNPNVDPALDGSYDRASGSVRLSARRLDGERLVEYRDANRNEWLTYRWNLDAG